MEGEYQILYYAYLETTYTQIYGKHII